MTADNNSYAIEFSWIAAGLILLLLIGYYLDRPWLFFSLGLLIYLGWHLVQLSLMVQWLKNNALDMPPDSKGLWGDVFRHLYRIQRHNRHRHEKLVVLLNRYKESTEAMPDATIILGSDLEIEWLNDKCEKYLGLKEKEDIGRQLTNLIRNPLFLDFINEQEKHKNGKNVLEIPSPDHKRTLSIRLIPYGQKHLLIARDISNIQHLKEVRKDFVANVSHELRTPLTVITGYLETLGENLSDEPIYASSISLMQQQSNRMTSIIDDLLLLSKIEGNEKTNKPIELVNMPALVMMLKKEAQVLSDGRHEITVETEAVDWLQGDEKELRSAFTNLVSNAIRYTPEGGKVFIRWFLNNNKACFEVEDTGDGIAPQHIGRLTERFYRVDVGRSRTTGGTGLGLAIVKHVLNHHEAKLVIESKIGEGSIFRCEFPMDMASKEVES